jgi:hypothetical protein
MGDFPFYSDREPLGEGRIRQRFQYPSIHNFPLTALFTESMESERGR